MGILRCIAATAAAPLLLATHWLRSKANARNKRSNFKIKPAMADGAAALRRPGPPPPPPGRPCAAVPRHDAFPHCNVSLAREERVRGLISSLTAEEKVSLLGHDSPAVSRPGMHLPAYKWWNEGLHGFAWTDCCPPHEWDDVTTFPQVTGLAAAWNRTLWGEVGGAIGTEAVGRRHATMNNGGLSPGLTYFTPNINIFRDPRWGRGQETPGEDPYLTSNYAAIMVMSLQYGSEWWRRLLGENDRGPDSDARDLSHPLMPRVAATCKHFAAYSLETNRFNFSADIGDPRDWDDTYLPAFDACIHAERYLRDYLGQTTDGDDSGGGALGVMCSYNSIDGTPACADPTLLKERLRDQWGFRGYVVSDCWAIHNIHEHHRYAGSYEEAVGMALRAGVDLDCGDTVQGYGMKALEEGHLDIADVDRALGNLFGALMDVGYFDVDDKPTKTASLEGYRSQKQYHDRVALEAALQSIVLLKNGPDETSQKAQLSLPLPLSITEHATITLVGPLADDEIAPLGNYHGIPSKVITPMQGLQDLGLEVDVRGCNVNGDSDEDNGDDLSDDSLCRRMNADSYATILVMGLNQKIEAEEIDRTSLLLPKVQADAIEEASKCSKETNPNAPVILVVMTGGPLDLSLYKTNNNIDAILYMSYPGQDGGTAIAHVLYGMHNPSGRLVTTMYPDAYLGRVELQDMRMRPEETGMLGDHGDDPYPGRTYRFYDGAVYPFGYGLSYSSWDYALELTTATGAHFGQGGRKVVSQIRVTVSNTGLMDGSDSVLLFHKGPDAGSGGNPIKSLIGFEKVFVGAGGTQRVKFWVEKWMTEQKAGAHTFMVGPSTSYTLQMDLSEGGVMA